MGKIIEETRSRWWCFLKAIDPWYQHSTSWFSLRQGTTVMWITGCSGITLIIIYVSMVNDNSQIITFSWLTWTAHVMWMVHIHVFLLWDELLEHCRSTPKRSVKFGMAQIEEPQKHEHDMTTQKGGWSHMIAGTLPIMISTTQTTTEPQDLINPALQPNSKRTICGNVYNDTVATVFPGIVAIFHKASYGKHIHI